MVGWQDAGRNPKKSSASVNLIFCCFLLDELLPHWQARWPSWSEQDVRDMRDQFQSVDLNGDGVVDLSEL